MNCVKLERGVFLKNGTWTDLLGMLDTKSCDFILGGFYPDNEVQEFFSVTNSYLSDCHIWVIEKAKKQFTWKGLIKIFNFQTWMYILFTLVAIFISWFIIEEIHQKIVYKSQIQNILSLMVLNVFGLLIGVSIKEKPKFTSLRILFLAITMYCMIISTLYTSNLIAVFTNPNYDHQISTIEEVISRKIPLGK